MKCPKCGGRLQVESGGYSKANVVNGFGFQLPEHESCMMCGYYKEVFPETAIPEEFQKGHTVNNYPTTRKPQGHPGWVKKYTEREYTRILQYRHNNMTWPEIQNKLVPRYPKLKDVQHSSIANIWRRVHKERCNV